MAMGMEVEIHRRITNANGDRLDGDTRLLSHPWFRLVSDKLTRDDVPYSNMEFVLRHFDQRTVARGAAVTALTDRLAAMRSMWTQLYAKTGALGTVVPEVQGVHKLMYYNSPTWGDTEDLLVAACPAADDRLLYVHYTVGFTPLEWRSMLTGILAVTRGDSEITRARTHLVNGRAVAATLVTDLDEAIRGAAVHPAAADLVRDELHGHLAMLYMHAAVFVDRTLSLQVAELKRDKAEKTRIDRVNAQLGFEGGQVKNKIAALPRATLSEMYGVLSEAAREVLRDNANAILDGLAARLEAAHGLDFPENYELASPEQGSATLAAFITAGLDGGRRISQQVLFGAMKEVGVDASIPGRNMIAFEFRSAFAGRVGWDELTRDATKMLDWSRNPGAGALV